MNDWTLRRVALPQLLVLILATIWAHSSVRAQPAASATTSAPRLRIVVFQFTSAPDDSGHRVFAATVARSLVHSLIADSAFQVMTHPRAARDAYRSAADAQYAVVGTVAELDGALSLDVRVLDIQHVALLGKETLAITDASSRGALLEATTELAGRIRNRINAAPLP